MIDPNDWREDYAEALGIQAYVFGFPWVYLPTLRYMWTNVPRDPARTPYAALNRFWHLRQLADASYRDGGSPNNDTLYSIAWLDLADEPVVLSHPEMGDRYFTFEIAGMDSDNFAYVGKRVTGSAGGEFAICGPNWNGELPDGVHALPSSRTDSVLIFGRTLVDGADDIANVIALQDQYLLSPLSRRGQQLPVESRDVWAPEPADDDPLAIWRTMNKAMTENPPGRHHDVTAGFADIGVGPGCDVDSQHPATKRGLATAATKGREILSNAMIALGPVRNGWNFPPPTMGRAGNSADFLTRSAVQCLGGIISNDPAEALYPLTKVDADGNPLHGSANYRLSFLPGELPPTDAFWSLSLYGVDANFVDNPIDRYSIGDRTPGLAFDTDGGLAIHVQSQAPDPAHQANWLPSSNNDTFYLVLRIYLPQPMVLDSWAPPHVHRIA